MDETENAPEGLKKRLLLYKRAVELRAKNWTQLKIAQELGVSRRTVTLWLAGRRPKRIWRHDPELSPSRDLAYVAGFYLGDGEGAGNEHEVRFNLAELDQLEYVSCLVAKILGREPKRWTFDGLFYAVQYDSVVLSEFLEQPIEALTKYLKGFERDFLRGFYDAEGYVSCQVHTHPRKLSSILVGVANTNWEYLETVKGLLANDGVSCTARVTNRRGEEMTIRGKTWLRRRDVFHLITSGFEASREFARQVGFRNNVKAAKLADSLKLQGMSPVDRYAWFAAHYRKEGRKWLRIRKQANL